ncbi:tetratricopeptide repeat protein [Sandarakinorhabdus oryzae]|uniref:tetratricopeptide repeat protein n=1 Tax=Sandarakinorhabdus oryzae TaxID=2675220 RepID=UPI0012E22BFB|nr:tetratricopeptide repeat protein [Sandarakinorhabdus oryzae]
MIQIMLTALAVLAIGLVAMRVMRAPADPAEGDATATTGQAGSTAGLLRPRNVYGGAGVLVLLAGVIALTRPADNAPAPADTAVAAAPVSFAATPLATRSLDDVDTMMARLEQRLKDKPDGEGYRMLGWSYQNTGRPAEALKAYARAIELLPDRADIRAGYGEAMVGVANDVVTPEAKAQFDRAARLDPKEPRARFFAGLWKLQHGKPRAALDDWIALSNDWSPEQRWQPDVRQRIEALAAREGVNIAGRLKLLTGAAQPVFPAGAAPPAAGQGISAEAVKAADSLSAPERQAMIDSMVEGLANRLKSNPGDLDGWLKLIRSRVVLKDLARARDELGMARMQFAGDPAKLAQLNDLAAELGLQAAP